MVANIKAVSTGSVVHPAALFPPTAKEQGARRHPASLVTSEGDEPEDVVSGKDENDAGDDDTADGEDTDRVTPEYDEPGENSMSPADAGASGHHNAA